MGGYQTVIDALDNYTIGWNGRVMAICPAHDDDRPSLSVAEGEGGRALVHCHAGCSTMEVVEALDLGMSDLFVNGPGGSVISDRYVYVDENGNNLIRVSRTEPKGFFQERWEEGEWKPGLRETRRVLYQLPVVSAAAASGDTVYVVEGEKDALMLLDRGVAATTCLGGAGKWNDSYTASLEGAKVVVVADQDEHGAGQKHAAQVAEATGGTLVKPKSGKDTTDHLLAGFTVDDFIPVTLDDPFEEWDPWSYEAPEDEWLFKPYVPRASRVLLHGPSGSLKTLWAMWLAWHLANEGEKVAFLSTEMNKGQMAKRFQRFPRPAGNKLKVYGSFMLGQNLGTAIKNWEGYALIVIDSWSSTQGSLSSNDNDGVARLDKEFFQPLVNATGATVMVIDNTGHDAFTSDGPVKKNHARGASRKRDIQEVELAFRRTDATNNFRTSIEVTKMRLDVPIPAKEVIETPQDRIEFYYVSQGAMSDRSMWPSKAERMRREEEDALARVIEELGATHE